MAAAVKFTFDTHFDDGAVHEERGETRSRKSYSADEIAVLCDTAREDGLNDGSVRAAQAMAASIGQVAAALVQAIEVMDAEIERMRAESAAIAFVAAKKLAGAALTSAPQTEIEEVLRVALHQAIGEPRIMVKTAPGLSHAIQEKAAELAAWEGFEGRLQFTADPTLFGADCRIEWRGGGIERSHEAIEHALADLLTRRFPNMIGEPNTKELQ